MLKSFILIIKSICHEEIQTLTTNKTTTPSEDEKIPEILNVTKISDGAGCNVEA